jgi:GNAT superfamily N-acetyltransferase
MTLPRERLERLTPRERAELARRVLGARRGATAIPRRGPDDPCPLSFAQQRLWFLDRLEQGNAAYNVYRAVRVSGPLDQGALRQALDEVVHRHEVLRTTFPSPGGLPVVRVGPPRPVPLPVEDLGGLPAAEQAAAVRRRAEAEAGCPFDLAGDFLLRTRLLRLGEQEHVLLLTTHHIVADGWSVGLLFSKLASLYEAFRAGRSSPLPELPIQYPDFARWQRRRLAGPALREQLAYWKGRFATLPPRLNLPTDRPREGRTSFRGARHFLLFPRAVLDGLAALGRGEGATLFMALLAGFKALLFRWTGQDDVAVGTPVAGRDWPVVEQLIGCFSNTLVLRTSLAEGPTFRELLRRVRETALGAFAHPEVPFEKLVEELRPRRVANETPLFQVNFRLLTAPQPPPRLSGLDLTFLEIDNHLAKFDLAFELCARPDGLGGYVEYFTDLFEPATARRLCGDFQNLLAEVVARPDAPLGASPRLVPAGTGPAARPGGALAVKRKGVALGGVLPDGHGTPAGLRPAPAGSPGLPRYSLRRATMRDCAFLYRLRAITLEPYVSQFPGWAEDQRQAYYLDFDPAIHEIIVVDGQDAGAVSILRNEAETRFINLHLLPEYQNRSLGTAIFQEAIAEAAARGVPVVLQGVLKTNPAVKLYRRLGFVITQETELRYVMTRPAPPR